MRKLLLAVLILCPLVGANCNPGVSPDEFGVGTIFEGINARPADAGQPIPEIGVNVRVRVINEAGVPAHVQVRFLIGAT